MKNENTLSDLIYLFGDGETTETEREILFKALADDKELQNEFHDSVCIQNSAVAEASTFAAPASLTKQLFAKAGLQTAASVSSGTLGTGAAAAKTLMPLLGKMIVPALTLCIGTFAGFLISDSFANDTGSENNTTIVSVLEEIPQAEMSVPIVEKRKGNDLAMSTPEKSTRRNARLISRHEEAVSTENSQVSTGTSENSNQTVVIPESPIQPLPIAVNEMDEEQKPSMDLNPQNKDMLSIEEEADYYNIVVSPKGIVGLVLLPDRQYQAASESELNNIGISIDYQFDENSYLGLEIGQETMDLFVANPSSDLKLTKALMWLGAHYKYELNNWLILDQFMPYTEFVLGGTLSGPIAKNRIGIQWMPESRVKLYCGIETTGLAYMYNKNLEFTGKFSVNYGVSVLF